MMTRSQAAKEKKNVPIRSARIMKRLLAKKQQVKEEHQLRVQAKKKGRVQKKKAGLCRKAKGTQSSSTAQTTSRSQTSSIIQINSSTQTSCSTYVSSSTQTSPQGQSSSSSLTGPGCIGLGCALGNTGPKSHILPCTGAPHKLVPERNEGRNDHENGRLNPNGEDPCYCLVRDCPGCFKQCPMCQSTKCGPLCRQNRICVYEVTADNKEVINTFFLPCTK